jgi:transposase-like protein
MYFRSYDRYKNWALPNVTMSTYMIIQVIWLTKKQKIYEADTRTITVKTIFILKFLQKTSIHITIRKAIMSNGSTYTRTSRHLCHLKVNDQKKIHNFACCSVLVSHIKA